MLVNDNSTGNDQIIAGEGINSVADLKGKKVAVEQGTVDHYLLLLALQKAGLTEKDIELIPLLTDAAAAAFVAGQVDAVGVFAPFTTTALERPGSKAIATSADFPGAIPDHLVVRPQTSSRTSPTRCRPWCRPGSTPSPGSRPTRTRPSTIMAKRAGVSDGGLRDLRRRHDDLHPAAEPRRVHPGHHVRRT